MHEQWHHQLRTWREAAELSRPQLARLAHVSVKNIYNLETGGQRPNRGTVTALADALDAELRRRSHPWSDTEAQHFRAGVIPAPRVSPENHVIPQQRTASRPTASPPTAVPPPASPPPAAPTATAPTSTAAPSIDGSTTELRTGHQDPTSADPLRSHTPSDGPATVRIRLRGPGRRRTVVGLTAGVLGISATVLGLTSISSPTFSGPPTIPASTDAARWFKAAHLTDVVHEPPSVAFGEIGDVPLVGDWDADRSEEPAIYRPSTGTFVFGKNHQPADVRVTAMDVGDWPLAGDWDADGRTDLGFYRPETAVFTLLTSDGSAAVDEIVFGDPGMQPVVGDWDGNGTDDVAVLRASDRMLIRRSATGRTLPGMPAGRPGDIVVIGDWDDDPADEVGTFRPDETSFVFSPDSGPDPAPVFFGDATQEPMPVMGDWDGDGDDTQAVVQNTSR